MSVITRQRRERTIADEEWPALLAQRIMKKEQRLAPAMLSAIVKCVCSSSIVAVSPSANALCNAMKLIYLGVNHISKHKEINNSHCTC